MIFFPRSSGFLSSFETGSIGALFFKQPRITLTKCCGSLLILASDSTLLMVLILMSVPASRVSLMDSSSLEVLQMLSSTTSG